MDRSKRWVLWIMLGLLGGCHHPARPSAVNFVPPPIPMSQPTDAVTPSAMNSAEVRTTAAMPISLTVNRQITDRQLGLGEAIAISLNNSPVVRTLDDGSLAVPGATAFDSAITAESRNVALAAFDTSYAANFYWNRFEGPPNSFFGPGIPRSERRDEAAYTTGFVKLWQLGTESRISYNPSPGYLYFPDGTDGFNPNHVSALEFSLRQPLLRGAGRDVNLAPINIAQLKTDQTIWEFKSGLLAFVRSVEEAYWGLQAARQAQRFTEEQVPLINEIVRIEEANLAVERAIAADVAKARSQQHALRKLVIEAQSTVRERELQLRNLMGLQPYDGTNLIPISEPLHAPLVIDPQGTVFTALNNQPLLIQQRMEVRIRELELDVARNLYNPQLDVQALSRANGLEQNLGDSLAMMLERDFVDWEFGARFSMPLGRNADRAAMRAAELQLQRERALLNENARLVVFQLMDIMRRIDMLQTQYQEAVARQQQANEWLRGARIRYENPPPIEGQENWLLLALDDYLLAIRNASDAGVDASFLLASYNTEIARMREAEGTLLLQSNVNLLGDPAQDSILQCLSKIDISVDDETFAAMNGRPSASREAIAPR